MSDSSKAKLNLEAFDQLPQEIRQLLASAPFPINSQFILAFYQRFGLAATKWRIEQGIAEVMEAIKKEG